MKVIFEEDTAVEKSLAKVITHPAEKSKWDRIQKAISESETQLRGNYHDDAA